MEGAGAVRLESGGMVAFLPQAVIDVELEFQQPWWNFREVQHRGDPRDRTEQALPLQR